jgi:alpha-L-rhamnosidase
MRSILLFSSLLMAGTLPAQEAPVNLKVEYLSEPAGIDVVRPRFYWTPGHAARGAQQTAWQIVVSRNAEVAAGEVWDSGKVAAPQFVHIVYEGAPLESGQTYYWKVRYWDHDGKASTYSRPARFGVGLLQPELWKGRWIAGGNMLRKEFRIEGKPAHAKAFIAAVGYYELYINGRKVGDHVLDPAYTPYAQRIFYETYDVTDYLREGANAVGLLLGEGWFGGRIALLQMNIDSGAGQMSVVTDTTWRAAQGPILFDSIYHGETYDATKEQPGWAEPGFADASWKPTTTPEAPKATLSAQMMPPIRVIQDITPFKMTNPRPGIYVYDMGQNFSGWVRLKVRGPRGTTVRVRHAELVYDDGTLNVENLRSARATDYYTLKGSGELEIYEPRFTYHGFRYVEITGYPGVPSMDTVLGRVVHSDVAPHGGFAASKPLLNQIQRLIQWGVTSNLHSIPTDCNQRDERMGWMADAHLYSETAMYNFDMAAFYTMWLRSIRDEQAGDGSVPDTTPRARFAQGPADPAWGSAYPIILWYMWQQYGDRRLLEDHFEGIRKWSDFLWSRSANGILDFVKFGDWVPVESTPGNLVSTAFSYWSADLVAGVADILGRPAEKEAYRRRSDHIKGAFHKKFFDPETGSYGNGSQTSNLLPLYLDMVPPEIRGRVAGALFNHIVYRWDSHLTTGILGTKYLLPYLTRGGNADLAYDIATKEDYPGWGYMITNGATTLWELWQKRVGPSMNSHNHPMFGSIGGWFFAELAGIGMQDRGEGYEKVRIRPTVIRDLRYASGSFESVRGTVSSSWRRLDDGVRLDVVIPFGSQAEVVIPKLGLSRVALDEAGQVVWAEGKLQLKTPGILGVKEAGDEVIVECGGGAYSFMLQGR